MSVSRSIDEFEEEELILELEKRRLFRFQGKCDYCGRRRDTMPCRFPKRHNPVKYSITSLREVCE